MGALFLQPLATPWDNPPQKEHALSEHPDLPGPFQMGRVILGRPCRAFCLITTRFPWRCHGLRVGCPVGAHTRTPVAAPMLLPPARARNEPSCLPFHKAAGSSSLPRMQRTELFTFPQGGWKLLPPAHATNAAPSHAPRSGKRHHQLPVPIHRPAASQRAERAYSWRAVPGGSPAGLTDHQRPIFSKSPGSACLSSARLNG